MYNCVLDSDIVKCFAGVSPRIVKKTHAALKLWQKDNNHTGLHFKRLVEIKRFKAFSIRITGPKAAGYRMIGRETAPGVISWFWLGDHEAYEREIARLR